MVVNDLNVKMTKAEFDKVNNNRTWGDNAGSFASGVICFYQGKHYISQHDNNNVCPGCAASVDWKEVIIEG